MPAGCRRSTSILLRGARPASGRAPRNPVQCRREIVEKCGIGPPGRLRAGDQHIIRLGVSPIGQDLGRRCAQPSLCPIADHRIAHLSARGKPDPQPGAFRPPHRPWGCLQDQARHDHPVAGRRNPQEIGADLECRQPAPTDRPPGGSERRKIARQADSRLRPFARLAASTRRPAAVAIRARNPWRRLRTRLLGW